MGDPEAANPEPPAEPKRLKSVADIIEEKYGGNNPISQKELADILLKDSEPILLQKQRFTNPAIPNDPGEIHDWPKTVDYRWVPCPSKTQPFHPKAGRNLESMEQNGWRFYDPRLFRDAPNNSGLPWKTIWKRMGPRSVGPIRGSCIGLAITMLGFAAPRSPRRTVSTMRSFTLGSTGESARNG